MADGRYQIYSKLLITLSKTINSCQVIRGVFITTGDNSIDEILDPLSSYDNCQQDEVLGAEMSKLLTHTRVLMAATEFSSRYDHGQTRHC